MAILIRSRFPVQVGVVPPNFIKSSKLQFMNSRTIEDLESFKKGFSVTSELKKLIDNRNESDTIRTYYMVGSPGQSRDGVPEQDIRIDSRTRGTELVLKEHEVLLYPV